jgi:hypothetical protein
VPVMLMLVGICKQTAHRFQTFAHESPAIPGGANPVARGAFKSARSQAPKTPLAK